MAKMLSTGSENGMVPKDLASPLSAVCAYWKDFDLESLRSKLDAQVRPNSFFIWQQYYEASEILLRYLVIGHLAA